jgi:hypothetical protein
LPAERGMFLTRNGERLSFDVLLALSHGEKDGVTFD